MFAEAAATANDENPKSSGGQLSGKKIKNKNNQNNHYFIIEPIIMVHFIILNEINGKFHYFNEINNSFKQQNFDTMSIKKIEY